MSTTVIRNRAQRRVVRPSGRLRQPSFDQIDRWAAIEEAKAKAQGRALPSAALHPDDVPNSMFHGVLNAIGRKPPLVRFQHCMESAREALRAGELRNAEAALRTCCSLLPRPEDEDFDAFYAASGGDDALDALESGLWAVGDGLAVHALRLISDYLDKRSAAA